MKKNFLFVMIMTLCLGILVGCGKSEAAQGVDDKIHKIGTVSLESENVIVEAEEAYSKLTDKEKKQLEYYQTLVDARNKYDILVKERKEKEDKLVEEIEALISSKKIKNAKEKINELGDNVALKEELTKKIQEKCYSGIDMLKFGEVVTMQADDIKEDGGDNYYYYYSYSELSSAYNQYYEYLNENAEKTSSDNFLFQTMNYSLDDKEVSLILFDTAVDDKYMIQISYK